MYLDEYEMKLKSISLAHEEKRGEINVSFHTFTSIELVDQFFSLRTTVKRDIWPSRGI